MNKKFYITMSVIAIALVVTVLLKKNTVEPISQNSQEINRVKKEVQEVEQSLLPDKAQGNTNEKVTVEELTRANSEGAVDIEITFLNPLENDPQFWIFSVSMNTHSVNLEQYNLSELVTFIVDGSSKAQNDLVINKKGASHHISYQIKIPKVINGQPVINDNTNSVALEIKDIDNVALRTFEWDIKQFQDQLTASGGN